MIKKLDLLNNTTHVFNDENCLVNVATGKDTIIKINEIIDAINTLWIDLNNHTCRLMELENTDNTDNTVADKFAEQRRWIGKLCKFRDEDYKDDQWDYGLLQAVENPLTAHIWKTGCFKHNLGHWYDYCEPVKPDADIIYKGKNKFTYQEIIIGGMNENKEE